MGEGKKKKTIKKNDKLAYCKSLRFISETFHMFIEDFLKD